jgi:hypothetical protein
MIYNDERPRSVWSDQLFLAERLQANPTLVPSNIEDRVLMFGLSNELCGENGFGWSRRLMLIDSVVGDPQAADEAKRECSPLAPSMATRPLPRLRRRAK